MTTRAAPRSWLIALGLGVGLLSGACRRGQFSEDPPIHWWDDMHAQAKFKAQSEFNKDSEEPVRPQDESLGKLFQDNRASRPLVEGVVAQGFDRDDEGYWTGKVGNAYLARSPVGVTEKVLARGEERFHIYCSPCHDHTGSGQGLIIKHGYPVPVDLTADHARGLADGEIFDIITHGVRNMPSYNTQVSVPDRWAIVTWVRVLQRSQHAATSDVPAGTAIAPEATP